MNDNVNLYYYLRYSGVVDNLPELDKFLADVNGDPGIAEELKKSTGYKSGDYRWIYGKLKEVGVDNMPDYSEFVKDIQGDPELFNRLIGVIEGTKKKSATGGSMSSGFTTGSRVESSALSEPTATLSGTPKLETQPSYHIPVSFTDDYKTSSSAPAPAAANSEAAGEEKHYYVIQKPVETYTDEEVGLVTEYRRKYSELLDMQRGITNSPSVLRPEYQEEYNIQRMKDLRDDVYTLWGQMKESGMVDGDNPIWVIPQIKGSPHEQQVVGNVKAKRVIGSSVMGRIAEFLHKSGIQNTQALGAGAMGMFDDGVNTESYLDELERTSPDKYKLVWEAAQQAGEPVSDIERIGETALSFFLDSPIFIATAAAGGAISSGILRGLSAGLSKTGLLPSVSEYIAGAATHGGAKLLSQKIVGGALSSGFNLGLYDVIADATQQAKEILDNGGSLNDFSAIQTLNQFGHGFAMGAGLSMVSIPLSAGGSKFVNMYENWASRALAKGVSKSIQLNAELLTFSGIGAALSENETLNSEFIIENAKLLAGIKLGGLPQGLIGKVVPLSQDKLRDKIKFDLAERKVLNEHGIKDIDNLTPEAMQALAGATDVPLVLKYKVLAKAYGVIPAGTISVTRVERDGSTVRGYRGNELVYDYAMPDPDTAERFVQNEYIYIKEADAKKAYGKLSREGKYVISEKFGKEETQAVEALNTPIEMRTPEQKVLAARFVREVELVTESVKEDVVSKEATDRVVSEKTPISEMKENLVDTKVEPSGKKDLGSLPPETKEIQTDTSVEPSGKKDSGRLPSEVKENQADVSVEPSSKRGMSGLPLYMKEIFSPEDISSEGKLVNLSEESFKKLAKATNVEGVLKVLDFKNTDKRLINYIINLVNSNAPSPEKTIERIGDVLRNSDRQVRIVKAMEMKEYISNTLKGAGFSDIRDLKRVSIHQGYSKNQMKAIVKFNGVRVDEMSDDLIDRYIQIAEGFKKGTPNRLAVQSFLNDYAEQVKLNKEIAAAEEGINVETRMENIQGRLEQVESLLNSENPSIEDVERAYRVLKSAVRGVRDLKKAGLSTDMHRVKDALSKLEGMMLEHGNRLDAIRVEKRSAYVKDLADKVLEVRDKVLSSHDKLVAEALAVELRKSSESKGVRYLSGENIELLNELIPSVERDGVIPVSIEKMIGDLRIANNLAKLNEIKQKLAGNATKKWGVLKELNALDLKSRLHKHQLNILGDYIGTTERVGKGVRPKYDPIYEFFSPVLEAVRKAKDRETELVSGLEEAISGKTNAVRKYVVNPRANESRERLKERAKVGMLMNQLSKYHDLMNMKKRVAMLPEGGYGVVDALGEFYRDETGKVIRFGTAKEAIEGSRAIPVERVSDGRYFDTYRLMRYTLQDGVEVDNPKWHTSVIGGGKKDKYYKEVFEEAYNELSKNLDERGLAAVRSEEDILKLLNENEKRIYFATKEVFNKAQEDVRAVAGLAGVTTDIREHYFPAMSRDIMRSTADADKFLNEYYANIYKTTGHILERTPYIQPVDLDVERVAKRYVREMVRHRYLMPEWRERRKALDMFIKLAGDNAGVQALGQYMKIRLDDGMAAELVGKSLFDNLDIVYEGKNGTKRIPLTTALSETMRTVRNVTLSKLERPAIDYVSAIIKYGEYGLPMNTSKWNKFAMQEGSIGQKDDVLLKEGRGGLGDIGSNSGRMALMESITNSMSSYGDNAPKFPAWIRVFRVSYKSLTGEEFDLDRYYNDVDYRVRVKGSTAYDRAKSVANRFIEQMSVSHSRFSDARELPLLGFTMSNDTRTSKYFMALARYGAQESANFYASLQTGDAGEILNRALRTYVANMAYNYMTQALYTSLGRLYSYMSDDEALKYEMDRLTDTLFSPEGLLMNGAASTLDLLLGKGGHAPKFMFSAMYFGALKMLSDSKYTEGIPEKLKQEVYMTERMWRPAASHALTGYNLFSSYFTLPEVGAVAMPVYGGGMLNMAENIGEFLDETIQTAKNFVTNPEGGKAEFVRRNGKPERFLLAIPYLTASFNPMSRNVNAFAEKMNRPVTVGVKREYAETIESLNTFTKVKSSFERLVEEKWKENSRIVDNLRKEGVISGEDIGDMAGVYYGEQPENVRLTQELMSSKYAVEFAFYTKGKANSAIYAYYVTNKNAQKAIDTSKELMEFAMKDTRLSKEERNRIFEAVKEEMDAIMNDFYQFEEAFGERYSELIDVNTSGSSGVIDISLDNVSYTFNYQPKGVIYELYSKYIRVPKIGKTSGVKAGLIDAQD